MYLSRVLVAIVVVIAAATFALGLALAQSSARPAGGASQVVPLSGGFTYQGYLQLSGSPHNGLCDLRFSLWDALSGGTQVGNANTLLNVMTTNGSFQVAVNGGGEFGSQAFTGAARWLELAVRCPGGSGGYTTLSPRQPVTATPYALGLRPGAVISGSLPIMPGIPGVLHLSSNQHGLVVDHAGQDGVLVCEAGYGGPCLNSASDNGVEIARAADSGVYVYNAQDGFRLQIAQNNGFVVSSAVWNGVQVLSAQRDGLSIDRTYDDGVQMNNVDHDGVKVVSAGFNGLYVVGAGRSGVEILSSAWDGIHVCSTGAEAGCGWFDLHNNGVEIGNAEHDGMSVVQSGRDGVYVYSAGDDGIHVVEAASEGLYVADSGDGVQVDNAVDNGVEVNGVTNWEGYFDGDINVTGSCTGCLIGYLGLNASDRPLFPGDIVTVEGVESSDLDNAQTLWRVAPAGDAQAAFGVVAGRAEVVTDDDETPWKAKAVNGWSYAKARSSPATMSRSSPTARCGSGWLRVRA